MQMLINKVQQEKNQNSAQSLNQSFRGNWAASKHNLTPLLMTKFQQEKNQNQSSNLWAVIELQQHNANVNEQISIRKKKPNSVMKHKKIGSENKGPQTDTHTQ